MPENPDFDAIAQALDPQPGVVRARLFTSSTQSWETLAAEAAEFASTIEPSRLINIAIAAAGGVDLGGSGAQGIIIVWYRDHHELDR
jgi:hypothetical protein